MERETQRDTKKEGATKREEDITIDQERLIERERQRDEERRRETMRETYRNTERQREAGRKGRVISNGEAELQGAKEKR